MLDTGQIQAARDKKRVHGEDQNQEVHLFKPGLINKKHAENRGQKQGQQDDGGGFIGLGGRVENEERGDDDQGKESEGHQYPPAPVG